jgi:hypothetical protein
VQVKFKQIGKEFRFDIAVEKGDKKKGVGQGGSEIEFAAKSFKFVLPFAVSEPHPDLIAVTILTVVAPWVGKKLTLPRAVSPKLAQTVKEFLNINIGPISQTVNPRKPGKVPSLSFSAGVDSTAASVILPENTVHLMNVRQDHSRLKRIDTGHDYSAALESMKSYPNAYAVYTDLEYVVAKVPQFPVWITLASQCLLLADHYKFNSVNFGTIMGSSYVHHGDTFHHHNRADYRGWGAVFRVIGMSVSKPVVGLAEIGTNTIATNSMYKEVAISCAYGKFQQPCMRCLKCFRKTLGTYATRKQKISKKVLMGFLKQPDVQAFMLGTPPLYFQHIFMYSVTHLDIESIPAMKLFKQKILLTGLNPEWCNYWYPKSLEQVYKPLRADVEKNIKKFMKPMSKRMQDYLEKWSLSAAYTKVLTKDPHAIEKIDAQLRVEFEKLNNPRKFFHIIPEPLRRIFRPVIRFILNKPS